MKNKIMMILVLPAFFGGVAGMYFHHINWILLSLYALLALIPLYLGTQPWALHAEDFDS